MMLLAVVGIRHAAPDPDAVLHALLADVIRECADLLTPAAAAAREGQPSAKIGRPGLAFRLRAAHNSSERPPVEAVPTTARR